MALDSRLRGNDGSAWARVAQQHLFAGQGEAALAAQVAAAGFQVEVVAVHRVVAGAEHTAEKLASTAVCSGQHQ